jgi:hypothetical protein
MNEERVKELILALIYATGWEEESGKKPDGKIFRTWKGYPFEILNTLERERLLLQYANSIVLEPAGLDRARELNARLKDVGPLLEWLEIEKRTYDAIRGAMKNEVKTPRDAALIAEGVIEGKRQLIEQFKVLLKSEEKWKTMIEEVETHKKTE